MKKFSKLITEKKSEERKMSPLTNPVDWVEIFKPLIDHIEGNLISNTPSPGSGIFSENTKAALDKFIDLVEDDYKEYFENEVHDGSQESFLSAFHINCDHNVIFDCITTLTDRTDDVVDYGNFDWGSFVIELKSIKYVDLNELIEDIEETHSKLKILKTNYKISIGIISRVIEIIDSDTNIGSIIRDEWVDSWGKESDDIKLFNDSKNSHVKIYIFNRETVQAIDLK